MRLSDFGYDNHSQFGEDGIIEQIFATIKPKSKVCVEFGAWDGYHFSNTANLWTHDWQAILIEADRNKFKQLLQNTAAYDCRCVQAFVEPKGQNTIDSILERLHVTDLDLISIDIDGDDYYIFDSIVRFRPRVVICEYNPTIPAEVELIPQPGNYFGCSARALVNLAERKGYRLVEMTESNCFFVTEEEYPHFSEYDTSIEALKFTKHLTFLYSGYDGDYALSRMPTFGFGQPTTIDFKGEHYLLTKPSLSKRVLARLRGLR